MEDVSLAPSPYFHEGWGVCFSSQEAEVSKRGLELSTFLKSGWGFRLISFSASARDILGVVGNLEGEFCVEVVILKLVELCEGLVR